MSDSKQKSIEELIANSSIGHALADIKKRGIDAHLIDLEAEMTPKRMRGRGKRSVAATKPKVQHELGSGIESHQNNKYGVSKIELGGKMSFIGANRRMSPTFTHWWNGLCRTLSAGPGTRFENPLPNIEAAHKAYLDNQGISVYAAQLTKQRLENEASNTLHARVSPKIGAPQYPKGKRFLEDIAQNMSYDDLLHRRKQNEDLSKYDIGLSRKNRIAAENAAIDSELRRREAQHSLETRNRITGQDPRLKISKDVLVSKLLDTARRLDRELAQLRQDLDRLAKLD